MPAVADFSRFGRAAAGRVPALIQKQLAAARRCPRRAKLHGWRALWVQRPVVEVCRYLRNKKKPLKLVEPNHISFFFLYPKTEAALHFVKFTFVYKDFTAATGSGRGLLTVLKRSRFQNKYFHTVPVV